MSLREVSGSLLPDGIHSTLNVVTIQFETDFYITKSGFAIDFSSKCQHPLYTTIIYDVFIISNSIKYLENDTKNIIAFTALFRCNNHVAKLSASNFDLRLFKQDTC